MKLIIKDFPGDEGKQSLTYKKKNKLFSMGKALYQLLDSFFLVSKSTRMDKVTNNKCWFKSNVRAIRDGYSRQ